MIELYDADWLSPVVVANAVTVLEMAQHGALFLGHGAGVGWYDPNDYPPAAERITDDQLSAVTVLLQRCALVLGGPHTLTDGDGEQIAANAVDISPAGRDLYLDLTDGRTN